MKKYLLFLFLLFFVVTGVFAQKRQITGKVIGASDQIPIPGVSVIEAGTSNGTITDLEGRYSISVDKNAKLQYSFVGMKSKTIDLAEYDTDKINIELSTTAVDIDQVVVVAYGSKKKRDIIGSVTKVKSEELTKVPNLSLSDALQGQATGLQISSSSGEPGARPTIRIRGVSSINAGVDPLWIVDGVPIYSGNNLGGNSHGATSLDPMAMINMKDIESIEVLKDAAATAIYGSRGANGVIIVTTKKGKEGQGYTNVDYSFGVTDLVKKPEDIGFCNTDEWFSLVDRARANSGLDPFNPRSITNLFIYREGEPVSHLTRKQAMAINTDWFDQILRKGTYHEINVSSTRGYKKGSFYMSLNYRKDNSVLINNGVKRMSGRINLDYEPIENLVVSSKINFAYAKTDMVARNANGAVGNGGGGSNAGFGNANSTALPWYPVYSSDHESGYWNPMSGVNLNAALDKDNREQYSDDYRGIGGLGIQYNAPFLKGLSFRADGQFDILQSNQVFWVSKHLREDGSRAEEQSIMQKNLNYLLNANFNRTFGKHAVNGLVGVEWTTQNRYKRKLDGQNLTGTYKQIGTPQEILDIFGGINNEQYFHGYIGRVGYKYNDKYLLEINSRYDATSKFLPENRWHLFLSYSAGWIISEENFFANLTHIVNFLKIRGSYGERGNQNVGDNRYLTTFNNKSDWSYGDDNLIREGTRPRLLGNPTITWETSKNTDVGMDFGLFQNRISGSFAYYRDNVSGLLLSVKLPPSTGFNKNEMSDNIGRMTNWGWEISMNTININRGGLKWTSDINLTLNQNEVEELTDEYSALPDGNKMIKEGHKLKEFFIPEYVGVHPEKGVDLIYEINRDLYEADYTTQKTGREIPATGANLKSHKMILEGKTEHPTYYGSFNNSFSYKNFDFNFMFYFSGGNYIYDYREQRASYVQYGQVVLRKDLLDNSWTPENPDARHPQLRWNSSYPYGWDPEQETDDPLAPNGKGDWIDESSNYNNESDNFSKFLYRGDFIRLRRVQVGYTLPKNLAQIIRMQSVRVYVSGQNLWTWTLEYNGWDPETGGNTLPISKIFSFGATLQF